MKNNLKKLENILQTNFNNKKLLVQSLTHKSFNEKYNNEKLEFLGDRVIGLVISKKLLNLYPDDSEGVIDKKFSNLVNKKTCQYIAFYVVMKKLILSKKSRSKKI